MDDEGDRATAAREIGDAALVAAVDDMRGAMAERAICHSGSRLGDKDEMIALGAGVRKPQPTPVREKISEAHGTLLRDTISDAKECKSTGRFFTSIAEEPLCLG